MIGVQELRKGTTFVDDDGFTKFANADDKRGRIVMSCMEPVTEGLIISIDDPEAKELSADASSPIRDG